MVYSQTCCGCCWFTPPQSATKSLQLSQFKGRTTPKLSVWLGALLACSEAMRAGMLMFMQGCTAYDAAEARGAGNVSLACAPPRSPDAFCSSDFCYVDARACSTRRSAPVAYLYNGRPVPASAQLAYSYQTCGFADQYTFTNVEQSVEQLQVVNMQGKVIRVTSPVVGEKAHAAAAAPPPARYNVTVQAASSYAMRSQPW